MSLLETSSLTATCVSTFSILSNASEELCLGLGQPDGSNNKKHGPFQNNELLPKSTKSPLLIEIFHGLQSPGANHHKFMSAEARIAFFLFSTQAFHHLSTDWIHQRRISESFQKYTSPSFTIILIALFTE